MVHLMSISYMFQQTDCHCQHALQHILQYRTHCIPNNMTYLTTTWKVYILIFPQICTLLKTFQIKFIESNNIIWGHSTHFVSLLMQRVICKDRKSKVIPLLPMKPYWGCVYKVSIFLNLGTRCKCVFSFTFLPFCHWTNIPQYALNIM